VLEPAELDELVLPGVLACIGLLRFLVDRWLFVLIVELVVLLLGLARLREIHELALHDAEAVEQLEDGARVEKRVPSLSSVLSLLEEAEPFEVANDRLVLGKLADQAPHRLAQLG
jgi:hypothetical protein